MGDTATQIYWNGIGLDDLRQEMDRPADDAVQSIYDSKSMHHLRDLLVNMAENDSMVSEELPKQMHDFVQDELNYKFTEKDIAMFRKTHEIWKEHGVKFCFILFFRSLPYTYMAEKPANVLRMTKLLEEQPERRIFETAQFVFDVMDEEWWTPKKRGVLTSLKVRIMHASMRHVILDKTGGELWDSERWGMPISQEDLIATNQTFSLEIIKGAQMMGIELSPEEKEAWYHHWKIIGMLMGVQDRLLSETVDEAWGLQLKIYEHLFNDTIYSGLGLTKSLVETMSHFMMNHKFVLLILRRMLKDDLFPDAFDRLLQPTYGKVYPEVFHKPVGQEETEDHDALLRKHFHEHLRDYHKRVTEHRDAHKHRNKPEGLFNRIKHWMFGGAGKKAHLIDLHLDAMHEIMHEGGTPIEVLEEEMIEKAMDTIGGVMVGVMSKYFRKGKRSGFRIPDNLREHWALERV